MRWKVKKPQAGDKKTKRRFAWWPVELSDGKVWMERYNENWEYKLKNCYGLGCGLYLGQYPAWVKVSKT